MEANRKGRWKGKRRRWYGCVRKKIASFTGKMENYFFYCIPHPIYRSLFLVTLPCTTYPHSCFSFAKGFVCRSGRKTPLFNAEHWPANWFVHYTRLYILPLLIFLSLTISLNFILPSSVSLIFFSGFITYQSCNGWTKCKTVFLALSIIQI